MSIKDAILADIESKGKPNVKEKEVKKNTASSSANGINKIRLTKNLDKLFYMRENLEEVRAGLHCSHVIDSEKDFCFRSAVLSLLFQQNQGELYPAKLMRIFAAGNNIHEKWQAFFDKTAEGKKKDIAVLGIGNEERSYSNMYELYFTPDSKILTLWDFRKYVLEIKSMNTYAFVAAKKAQSHPKALKQVMMYMYLTGIPFGMILIEDKNTQDYDIIFVEYDPEVVKPYIHRLYAVQELKTEFLEDNSLPPKMCSDCNSKKAKQCNMRDACFEMGIGRVSL